jgi:RNA-directed DNA polymerase
VKIKANASIYDSNLIYFAKRLSLTNPRIKSLRNLIVKQKYSYTHCGLFMLPNDVIELHHILDKDGNRTGEIHFVHGYCHDHIHSTN